MSTELLFHVGGLVLGFASVTIGSYGLLRQIARLGLLPIERRQGRGWVQELAHRLGRVAVERNWFASLRRSVEVDLTKTRSVDVRADAFIGGAMLYAVIAAIAVWIFTITAGGAWWNVIPAAVAGFVVFQFPGWNLRGKAHTRTARIARQLPYSLEVVVLATDTGAGFEESLEILVREDPKNPLHEEFDQVLRDTHLGLTRKEALHGMVDRIGSEDLANLVMALDVADGLGTPMAETLKKQALAIRKSRIQRAERLSKEAGPKMALPNTMIMLANVLLILGPFIPKLSGLSSL
jgi:Flp pilus assembly protein TadB